MKNKSITNEELQKKLTECLRSIGKKGSDLKKISAYASVSGKILSSVKFDYQSARDEGRPLLSRTKQFLGIVDEK